MQRKRTPLNYFIYFLGLLGVTFAAQVACFAILSDGYWSWWILWGALFQSLLLIGLFPFCKKPLPLLGLIFWIEFELLFADALKVRILGTSLVPGDVYLIPEFLSLLATLAWAKKLGFYALSLLLPLSWAGLVYALVRWRRGPRRFELAWLSPLALIAVWLFGFPGSYRHTLAGFIGDEPIQRQTRGETFGRLLSLSMELGGILEEVRYQPSAEDVVEAQKWFRQTSPGNSFKIPPKKTSPRNIYIILVESFWDPGQLHSPLIANGKSLPFLAPEFTAAWKANGSAFMFSPVYGSGTANTEFEILCGIPAATVNEGIVLLEGLSNSLPCLPHILHENGYLSFAFHPNLGGYYNRAKQFPAIGFDRFFDIDDFKPDLMTGSFLADKSFIHQSLDLAKKNSGGKPYLAYLMTLAGHWPYPWSDEIYPHAFAVDPARGQGDMFDEIARQLNINLYTSKLIADTLVQLSQDDPGALIVVAGDHLPPTALSLAGFEGRATRFLTEPVWYQTPFLFIDGVAPVDSGPVAAFELGNRILDAVAIPRDKRYHFQFFGRPGLDLVRPVVPGKIFHLRGQGEFRLCNSSSREPECRVPTEWMQHAHALGIDLARGKQYGLSPAK